MNKLKKGIINAGIAAWASFGLGGAVALAQNQPTPAGEEPAEKPGEEAPPTAMTTPGMSAPLVANPNPFSFDAGPVGPVYVTGAVSGLGLWQNNKAPDQEHSLAS
jgi:hypothetical protein